MSSVVSDIVAKVGQKVSWFPGHMAKTTTELAGMINKVDIVIEVRDARIPFSSANHVLNNITRVNGVTKPRVIVFNKSDLALPSLFPRVTEYERRLGNEVIFTNAKSGSNVRTVLDAVDRIPSKSSKFKIAGTTMIIVGIPNVGKSSLINSLRKENSYKVGSRGALVAPTPGYTKHISMFQIRQSPALFLSDTPGVMIPNLKDNETGMKLLVTGAIKGSIVPPTLQVEYLLYYFETVGYEGYLDVLGLKKSYSYEETMDLLEEVASRNKMMHKDNSFDVTSAAERVLSLFSSGKFGKHTLDYIPGEDEIDSFIAASSSLSLQR